MSIRRISITHDEFLNIVANLPRSISGYERFQSIESTSEEETLSHDGQQAVQAHSEETQEEEDAYHDVHDVAGVWTGGNEIRGTKESPIQPTLRVKTKQFKHRLEAMGTNIYTKGFKEGKFSDVNIRILDHVFKLHRIIITQNEYFAGLFEGPWKDNGQDEGVCELEILVEDENMTVEAVAVIFERLYGEVSVSIHEHNVKSLLATACFFGDIDLAEECTSYILAHLDSANLVDMLQFADDHFYGTYTDAIIDACFTIMCRNGTDKDLKPCFVQIPLKWLEKVAAADCFFVKDEYERYKFFKSIMEERNRVACIQGDDSALDLSSLSISATTPTDQKPDVSFDHDSDHETYAYENIIKEAVLYPHMTLSQLSKVESDRIIAENVLHRAVWQTLRLRATIEESEHTQSELGVKDLPDGIIPTDDTDKIDGRRLTNVARNSILSYSYNKMKFPPFRFGVEFDLSKLDDSQRLHSDKVFYGGSYWHVYIQKIVGVDKKLGIYLQRLDATEVIQRNTKDKTLCYVDPRTEIRVWFKIYAFFANGKCCVLESKPDVFKNTQSWGWRSHKLYKDAFREIGPLRCVAVLGFV